MERLRSFVISCCPECSSSYSARSLQGRIEKKPLILPCSHCICESCLVKGLKAPGDTITCKDCSDEIVAPPTYVSTRPEAEFPVNYCLLGLSILKSKASEDSGIGFNKIKQSKSAQRPQKKVKKCHECIDRYAEKQCLNCDEPYCSVCFTKIHESARALRSHVATDLETSISPVIRTMCLLHPASPQQAWCEQCSMAICTNCLIHDHCGHKAQPLIQKNKELSETLTDLLIKVMNIGGRLKATSKRASLMATRRYGEPLQAERQISDFFSRLHGALLLKQHHLLAELYAPSHGQANVLQSLVSDMEDTQEKLDTLVAAARMAIVDKRLHAQASFADLVEELKGYVDQPCHLLINEDEDSTDFCIDEDAVLSVLDSSCILRTKNNSESRYKLVTTENLPKDYAIEPLPEVTKENLFQLAPGLLYPSPEQPLSGATSQSSLDTTPLAPHLSSSSSRASMSSDLDNQNQEGDSSSQSNYIFDELLPGVTFLAKVVHVVSPSDFYVQKVHLTKKLFEMELKINEINFRFKKELSYIKMNSLYMVKYSEDSKWYRGKVIATTDKGFKVFYIDYGNTEIVAQESIRQMPTSLYKPPGLALHCCLSGCVPPVGETWKSEAVAKMLRIIDGSQVSLTIQKKIDNTLYVDMYKVDQHQGQICIQDSLIFLGLAVYLSNVNVKPPAPIPMKGISNPPQLAPGEVIDTFISAISSPDEFYVQSTSFKHKIQLLKDDLQEFYSQKNLKYSIYSPKKGTIVAAMRSLDNQWYRAKIIDIPGVKMVKVEYLDYGYVEEIGWQRIRVLANKFFSFYKLCYKCSLVDIAPVEKEWDPSAKYILSRAIKDPRIDTDLSVVVHSAVADKYRVVLYQRDGIHWICLNTLLVNEGAAKSTGSNSTIMLYTTPGSVKPVSTGSEARISLLGTGDKKLKPDMQSSGKEKDPIKIPVKIIRIVSPGEFYFTLTPIIDSLAQMKQNLNALYNKKSAELKLTDLKTGASCVVRKPESNTEWYRGFIVGIEDDTVKVDLVDVGEVISVPKDKLCRMEKKFEEQHDGAKKCHLGGIIPPFIDDGWPLTAISEFKEIVDKSKDSVYVTGMGEIVDDSIPVHVFLKEDIISGALEPTRTKWTSVNNLLRKNGLAKPDGTIDWETETSFETVTKSTQKMYDEIMSFPAKYHGLASNLEEAVDALPQLAKRPPAPVDLVAGKGFSPASPGPDLVLGIPPPKMPEAWPAPLPFTRKSFIANPTNVDNDCSIFIQDFQSSITILKQIGETLENVCKFSLAMPYDFYWNVGETCICRYHADHKWYRGVVTEVSDSNEMKVLMVDYGSIEEKVTVEDLRKMPLAADIPIQGQFCKVKKIVAAKGKKWSTADLDLIHLLVVEKHCPVELEELPDGSGYEIIKITLANGADLFDSLISENVAKYASDDLSTDGEEVIMTKVVEAQRKALSIADPSSAVVEEVVLSEPKKTVKPLLATSSFEEAAKATTLVWKSVTDTKIQDVVGLDVRCKAESVKDASSESSLKGSLGKMSAQSSSWVQECESAGLLSSNTPSESTDAQINIPTLTQAPSNISLAPLNQGDTEDDLLDSEESGYMYMSIPDEVDQLEVEVQLMVAPNRVVLRVCRSNNICIETSNIDFVKLMGTIQTEAEGQPILSDAQKGCSCIAKFSADNKWYRGIIEEVLPNNKVNVKYVDYGNMEVHPISEVRQLKFEWTDVEVQGIEAILYNIKATKATLSIKRHLEETLCGQLLTAKVKERSPELVIELYNTGTHELAYSDLVKKGILEFLNNSH